MSEEKIRAHAEGGETDESKDQTKEHGLSEQENLKREESAAGVLVSYCSCTCIL